MLTVPEAAVIVNRDPETIRRWIRSGRLRARKIGTQHVIEEGDLASVAPASETIPLPQRWRTFDSGRDLPDVVSAIARSRAGR